MWEEKWDGVLEKLAVNFAKTKLTRKKKTSQTKFGGGPGNCKEM